MNENKETTELIDSNFSGSIFESLGFEARLCPVCHAHLYKGICLNACHLTSEDRTRFNALLKLTSKKEEPT
jgi:hypothetical protein